jgi:hypothetical protein
VVVEGRGGEKKGDLDNGEIARRAHHAAQGGAGVGLGTEGAVDSRVLEGGSRSEVR